MMFMISNYKYDYSDEVKLYSSYVSILVSRLDRDINYLACLVSVGGKVEVSAGTRRNTMLCNSIALRSEKKRVKVRFTF